jgi:hypothetical protein
MTDGPTRLPELFSREPWRTDALDLFVGRCLTSAGIWEHPRTSDGITSIERVFERGCGGIGICARIWEIDDQSLHQFWLEIRREADSDHIAWSLYFDVIESSRRRALDAVHNHDSADSIEWRAKLAGRATVVDGVLTIVPGSTHVTMQDEGEVPPLAPHVAPPGPRRGHRRRNGH